MAFIKDKVAQRDRSHLRAVYGSMEGRVELTRMVVEGEVFSTINPRDDDSLERMTRRNDALELLYRLGILVDENIASIVDILLDMAYTKGDE